MKIEPASGLRELTGRAERFGCLGIWRDWGTGLVKLHVGGLGVISEIKTIRLDRGIRPTAGVYTFQCVICCKKLDIRSQTRPM